MPPTPRTFPAFRLGGTHRTIGRQFGEACGDLIHRHRDLALTRLSRNKQLTPAQALTAAAKYRDYVREHAPFLDEEVQGVAEGAHLPLAEAYLLQLRAEVAAPTPASPAPRLADPQDQGDECTTFAILAGATPDNTPLVGQNADLPAFYREIGVVLEIYPDDSPAVLMLTPAGQVSYIGINAAGLGVFANFLTCDGWRLGFPRYFLSRLALTHDSVESAVAAIRAVPRASSRNLIMLDSHGVAADIETTPTSDARLNPERDLLAHSNHYIAESLRHEERVSDSYLPNTETRLSRMRELLNEHHGQLNATTMQTILRDRATYPNTLSRALGDAANSDTITFASVIAAPSRGEMWVAVGPPHEHDYHHHAFGTAPIAPDPTREPIVAD